MRLSRSLFAPLGAVLTLALGSCGGSPPRAAPLVTELPPVDAADEVAFARAMNALGLDVWRGLRTSGRGDENLALSPASLATALAMTYGGARGTTAEAMRTALHLASDPDATMSAAGALQTRWNDPSRETYQLAVANRLFAEREYDFRQAYLDATRERFGAELERVDFRGAPEPARVLINEWVLDRTHDRIRELLPMGSIGGDTRLVLVNAVYFKGRWLRELDPEQTTELPFFVRGSESVAVPTMRTRGGRYGEDEGVQLLELPYAGEELAMLVVLPRDRAGLAAVEERLDAELVAQWAERVRERRDLEVQLPRFRIETDSMPLEPILSALGMEIAFSDAADFSGMSEPNEMPLKIEDVFHRVFVEVNEEGTEAAAATGVVMVEISAALPDAEPPRFFADHPFLFFLRDVRTGAILFTGRVTDPR